MFEAYTIEYIVEKTKKVSNGKIKCLSSHYSGQREKLKFRCVDKNHVFYKSWMMFYRDTECKLCTLESRMESKLEFVKKYANSIKYKCLSNKYKNDKNKFKLKFVCPNGHEFSMSWNKFCYRGHRCPECRKVTDEHKKEYKKNWYEANKERLRERQKERLASPIGRALHNSTNARYKATKKKYTPNLTPEEKSMIDYIYRFTQFLSRFGPYFGESWTVDHIVPISKSGLHHPNNLQLLTKSDNSRKNNRLESNIDPMYIISVEEMNIGELL